MSIQVKNLKHIYGEGMKEESIALAGVSFDIEKGSFVGIIGHTGSGKSTLVQHLNGLLKPNEGDIFVGGKEITKKGISMLEIRRKTGLVFQYPEYQLFEETVAQDVAFGPKNLGLDDGEIEDRVKEALRLVDLNFEEIKDKSPFDLSGGQKRRVAIAGVLAMKPEVLILDEPTAGLDPKSHKDILKRIEEIHKKEKNITILVSHNMNDIARLCSKVLVMDKGRLVMCDTPEKVFSKGEELAKMGLDLPDTTKLMKTLSQKGFETEEGVFTIEKAEEIISRQLLKEKK